MTHAPGRTYGYAVLDGNQAQDIPVAPYSCHLTRAAAVAEAARLNAADPNAHYLAVAWGGRRWAREYWPCCVEA